MQEMKSTLVFSLSVLLSSCCSQTKPTETPSAPAPRAQVPKAAPLDVAFAKVDDVDLLLDVHLPEGVSRPPLVVYIHGGGWSQGSRKNCPMRWLTEHGYAVASIEYRLSTEARFPAQIHDCKGALRWLRAHQDVYGYDATRVVVAGRSAGGHLATMMGTSAEVAELEGTTAGHLLQSSRVQGIIDYYGPQDFIFRSETQPEITDNPKGLVYQLLGGPVKENQALARLASPVTHVGPGDPPLLILHGSDDRQVLPNQSQRLLETYRANGLDAHLRIEPGGRHGWKPTSTEEQELVLGFLRRILVQERSDMPRTLSSSNIASPGNG